MTESNKSGSIKDAKASNEKEALKDEKKKVKVLKSALKDGKKAQEAAEAELKGAIGKIDTMSTQMQDKVR